MKCFSLILIAKGVEPRIRRTERIRERKREGEAFWRSRARKWIIEARLSSELGIEKPS